MSDRDALAPPSAPADDADVGQPAVARTRRRLVLTVAAVATIIAGLTIAMTLSGFLADATADALYTVLVYLLVAALFPRLSALVAALIAFGASALIEFSQLAGLGSTLAELFPPARLVFGTTFVATDLVFYAVGAALVATADVLVTRWARQRQDRPAGTSRRP